MHWITHICQWIAFAAHANISTSTTHSDTVCLCWGVCWRITSFLRSLMYVCLVKDNNRCLMWTYRSPSVNNINKAAVLYRLWIMCVCQNWYLDPCLMYQSSFAKQHNIVAAMICMFVSFSFVRLLAPLHRALLITSPSWGPYVSQLCQQQTFSIFSFFLRGKWESRCMQKLLFPITCLLPECVENVKQTKTTKSFQLMNMNECFLFMNWCVCNSAIPSFFHSCMQVF